MYAKWKVMKENPRKVLEKTMQVQDPIKTKKKTEDSDLIPLKIWFHLILQP